MADLTPYLLAVLIVVGALLLLGFRRRILLRIGVRNFLRRKSQVALAVAGLLIATSIISGSLVMGDSFDATVRDTVFRELHLVDEAVWLPNGVATYAGTPFIVRPKAFFNESIYVSARSRIGDMPYVDGLAPQILLASSVLDVKTGFVEPAGVLVAFDPAQDFDAFQVAGHAYVGGDLAPGEVLINADLAQQLGAGAGDSVQVFTTLGKAQVRVHAIVDNDGKGGLFGNPNLFMRLSEAQTFLNATGQINAIFVSNRGGVDDGYLVTEQVLAELRVVLAPGLTIDPLKQEGLADAEASTGWIKQIFSFVGIFTIIAGVLLIMNIFIVLAEERKSEMGLSRALGMRRTHLTETFVFEGLLYALAASAIGTLAGLGVAAFGFVTFSVLPTGGRTSAFVYHFELSSLVIAFAIGFLVTMTVVVLSSSRVSRLNIVRAIRNLPEPVGRRGTRRQWMLGAVGIVLGSIAIWQAIVLESPLLVMLGPSLLAYGLAGVGQRVVGGRPAYTGAALAVAGWALAPQRFDLYAAGGFPLDAFVASSVILVLSAIVALVLNSRFLLAGLTAVAGRRRSLRPVVKTAVSYPLARKGRTGLTLAIFALTVFVITLASVLSTLFFGDVDRFLQDQSGGYDIVARATVPRPDLNFSSDFAAAPVASMIAYYSAFNGSLATILGGTSEASSYSVFGVTQAFASQNGFSFDSLLPEYQTPRRAWEAVAANPDLAIFNGGFGTQPPVGARIQATNLRGASRTFTVIGVLREFFVTGMFVRDSVASDFFFADAPTGFLFKVASNTSPGDVKRELERDFVSYGMEASVFRDVVDQVLKFNLSFFRLIQSFLAMGLIVGLAGLGVVTMRNVVERRSQIGAMRAIGFRRGMILKYLLIENSFVSLVGIALGMLLGIAYAYYTFRQFPQLGNVPFTIAWTELIVIGIVAYSAGLVATVPPARRAARLPPAEALRIVE